MKPLALTLGLSGLVIGIFGSYQIACGFLILAIWFALQWLTDPRPS